MADIKEVNFKKKYKNKYLLRWDDIGTVRTGKEWFNRYMIFPWEKIGEFEEVKEEQS